MGLLKAVDMMTTENYKMQKQIEELKIKLSKALEDENFNQNDILRISQDLDKIINQLTNK